MESQRTKSGPAGLAGMGKDGREVDAPRRCVRDDLTSRGVAQRGSAWPTRVPFAAYIALHVHLLSP